MLKVPHYRQSRPNTCLPTCVRMILAYHGKDHTEAELAKLFGTVPFGTLPENVVAGLEQLGYWGFWFENATIERLSVLLGQGWPVIVFFRAADLPHGTRGLHSVVVVEIQDGQVICLDPALDHNLLLEMPIFLHAWAKLNHQGFVVWI